MRFPIAATAAILSTLVTRGQSEPQYPTSQRIQIPESCSTVAKWLSQSLASGEHFQLLRYDPDLGVLTFNVVSMNLTKSEARQYLDSGNVKNVHADQMIFTLRSLVTSSLSFDGSHSSKGESCTVAAAMKYKSKDGTSVGSNGKIEAETLQSIKDRYASHGLDY